MTQLAGGHFGAEQGDGKPATFDLTVVTLLTVNEG